MMTGTPGGGQWRIKCSTETGKLSSDTGHMQNRITMEVKNIVLLSLTLDTGTIFLVKKLLQQSVLMSEVRILTTDREFISQQPTPLSQPIEW